MIELGRRDCLAPTFCDSHPELMLRKSSYTCNKGELESNWAEPQVSDHEHLGCSYGEKRESQKTLLMFGGFTGGSLEKECGGGRTF